VLEETYGGSWACGRRQMIPKVEDWMRIAPRAYQESNSHMHTVMLSYSNTTDDFRIASSHSSLNYRAIDITITLEMIEDEQAIPVLRKTEKAIKDLIEVLTTRGGQGPSQGRFRG